MTLRPLLLAAVLVASAWCRARGGDAPRFLGQVAPILEARCLECHREGKARGRYRLDTYSRLLVPGSSDAVPVRPGDPGGSHWMALIDHADPDERMPQDAPALPPAERGILAAWILAGAAYDGPDPGVPWVEQVRPSPRPAPAVYPRPVAVCALGFSPDSAELASAGHNEVLVWRVADGGLARRLPGMPERIRALAWSPDGEFLAVAGGTPGRSGEALLVRARDGVVERVLARGQDEMLSAAFSPDGSRLAVGGTDGSIHLFAMPDGRRLLRLPHHADWVTGLAWSPDGRRFASASRDRTSRVVAADSGEGIASFTAHGSAVLAVAFTPDGKRVWSGGRDRVLRLWDAEQSEQRRQWTGYDGEILGMASGGGRLATVAEDGRLRIHPSGGEGDAAVREADRIRLESVAISPDGRRVAAGSEDGRIWLWLLDESGPGRVWKAWPGAPGS